MKVYLKKFLFIIMILITITSCGGSGSSTKDITDNPTPINFYYYKILDYTNNNLNKLDLFKNNGFDLSAYYFSGGTSLIDNNSVSGLRYLLLHEETSNTWFKCTDENFNQDIVANYKIENFTIKFGDLEAPFFSGEWVTGENFVEIKSQETYMKLEGIMAIEAIDNCTKFNFLNN